MKRLAETKLEYDAVNLKFEGNGKGLKENLESAPNESS
jgi:hypothetical protein